MKNLKEILKFNNWFTAHLLSAHKKSNDETKKHKDALYLELNRQWKDLVNRMDKEDVLCAEIERKDKLIKKVLNRLLWVDALGELHEGIDGSLLDEMGKEIGRSDGYKNR